LVARGQSLSRQDAADSPILIRVIESAAAVADAGVFGSRRAVAQDHVGLAVAVDVFWIHPVESGAPEQGYEVEGARTRAGSEVRQRGIHVIHHHVRRGMSGEIRQSNGGEAVGEYQRREGEPARPVADAGGGVAVGRVVQDYVRPAVAVQISDIDEIVIGTDLKRMEREHGGIAIGRVVREKVGLAVAVEVRQPEVGVPDIDQRVLVREWPLPLLMPVYIVPVELLYKVKSVLPSPLRSPGATES